MSLSESRIRHTRIFCAVLIPLTILIAPHCPENSLLHELLEFGGHVFVSVGVLLRIFATVYIGGKKNETIATDGPFSIVRNPLYVGTFFASLGLAMLTASFLMIAIVTIAFCLYYRVTVLREETFLREAFGADYHTYSARVPRWMPAPRLWSEPAQLTINPYFVRQAVLDASVLLLTIPLLEVLCELREARLVPTLMTLP